MQSQARTKNNNKKNLGPSFPAIASPLIGQAGKTCLGTPILKEITNPLPATDQFSKCFAF